MLFYNGDLIVAIKYFTYNKVSGLLDCERKRVNGLADTDKAE